MVADWGTPVYDCIEDDTTEYFQFLVNGHVDVWPRGPVAETPVAARAFWRPLFPGRRASPLSPWLA